MSRDSQSDWCFVRQDAYTNCCIPRHASGVAIAQLNRGLPVEQPIDEPALVRISDGVGEPADFMERPFVVITDRMRSAFERAGVNNVQYFRANVQREWSEKVESGYWLANVLGVVACVDPLASNLDDDVALVEVPSLVIDPARTLGLGLFRLAEDTRLIVAGPHVQAVLRASGLQGVLFQPPSAYDGGRAISRAELDQAARLSSETSACQP